MQPANAMAKYMTRENLKILETHGFLVIPNVIQAEECDRIRNGLIDAFKLWDKNLTLENPDYWLQKNRPAGDIHGITRVFADLQGQWDVRQNPEVAKVFAEYWQVTSVHDLVTSRDAFNFYHANYVPRVKGNEFWCHVDLGNATTGPAFRCVQAYVTLEDSTGGGDGTLVAWDRGHRIFKRYFELHPEEIPKSKGDWYRYSEEFVARMEQDCREYLSDDDPEKHSPTPVPMTRTFVHAPKGAMVLWYSRTPHMNRRPVAIEAQQPHHRLVVYVCMAPRKYLTEKDRKMRKKAWEGRLQTSHWPCFNKVKIFPMYPRTYSKEAEEVIKPKINKLYKRLRKPKRAPKLTALGRSLLGV